MTAAELLVQRLWNRDVHWIATLCGHGLDPLLNAAREAGLRLVDVRNEQTCAYIADAFGRLTGRPGVCAVSSGVAHVNALAGVANADFACGPMLLISGAAAVTTRGKGHFQELDQVALARPLTRFSASIDSPELTLPLLDKAYSKALAIPPGPVHLMFPLDVQVAECSGPKIGEVTSPLSSSVIIDSDLQATARALAAAKSPLVIAGSGIYPNQIAYQLVDFCADFDVPFVTPIWDRGLVDRPSPNFLGVIGAATGGPDVLSDADFILLAGAENDYRVGYLQPPAVREDARIFRMDGGWRDLPEECGKSRKRHAAAREAWLAACIKRRDEFVHAVEARAEDQARQGLHAIHIIRAIRDVLDEKPVLLIDGGSIGQWAHQLLCRDRYPSDWLTCGRSGVVGWGIGGAMAARLAFPERPVILLSGDGAFTFNVADIECAVRQNLPFVAIVADDQGWGITRLGHVRQFGQPVASSLGPIAFDRLADSLGARGIRVSSPADIARELMQAIAKPEVTVIHVPIVGGNP
jgi:acetolactate synthase-1/2/3 large subunit